jgi:hypothetical protein
MVQPRGTPAESQGTWAPTWDGLRAIEDERKHQKTSIRESPGIEPESSTTAWQVDALGVLTAGLTSSSVKVRWNACYAVAALFQRPSGADFAARAGHMEPLLDCLLGLMLHEENLKVRM